ncbi:MAG: hypothetical protein O3C66_06650 [Proteobacteria bacterium]|nr:hypothetical protein [Pseudomonadota bacterium]
MQLHTRFRKKYAGEQGIWNFYLLDVAYSLQYLTNPKKITHKSDVGLCYSLIYQKAAISNEYHSLLNQEATNRALNCRNIAQEIIDYKTNPTGSSIVSPSSASEAASQVYANQGVNWVIGKSS